MKYYEINENTARIANDANSFRDYETGKATAEYRYYVDMAYSILDRIETEKPKQYEKAAYMVDRYSKRMADYYNNYYRNEASCPSVMISGPANFPVRKKEKQHSRRQSLAEEWNKLQHYYRRIEDLLRNDLPIMAGDDDAIERIQDKINDLEEQKEIMKELNKHFRKGGTVESCGIDLPDWAVKHIAFCQKFDFAVQFSTANANQEIKRLTDRLESIKKAKESGPSEETAADGLFTVVRNTDVMRLQLIFDGKPDADVREILKKNGFKWAPSFGAWQRVLNNNSDYALQSVIKSLKEI